MKTFVSACLFLTLVSAVSPGPSVCWACSTYGCRPGSIRLCTPGTIEKTCYSKIVDFPLGNENRYLTIRHKQGCMSLKDCHPVNYTASLPNGGYIYMEVKCCNKSFCNDPISVPKQESRALNGLQCPGCLKTKSKEPCTSEATVSCHGQENKCVSYTGRFKTPRMYYPILSMKGCATKNLCDLITGASEEGKDLLEASDTVKVECSSAESPV